MEDIQVLRQQVKSYIDSADEKVVRMIHAMLQVAVADNNKATTEANVPVDDFGSFPTSDDGEGVLYEASRH